MAEEVEERKEKVKEKKGKKPRSKSKHRDVKIWEKYKGGKFTGRWCPRCGTGVMLAHHSNRLSCGRCHYSEIKK